MSWQMDGIAQPDMATMLVMLEDTSQLSGCLYFLPGTHQMGRVDPYLDESTVYKLWATPVDQMKEILARHPEPVPITGKAGTAAIFHCNLLHASGHNLSHRDRWAVYMCYNRCANRPADVPAPRPEYVRGTDWTPLEPMPEDAIVEPAADAAAWPPREPRRDRSRMDESEGQLLPGSYR
jgi:ectoine hydroxylase